MPIVGLRDTGLFETDQRPKNWREGISLLFPNGMAPLVALTPAMRTQITDDPEFNWWEKQLANQRLELGADITNVETATFTIVAGTPTGGVIEGPNPATDSGPKTQGGALQARLGHILLIEQTGELVEVTQVATTDIGANLEIARGFGGTTAALVTVATMNPFMTIVGNVNEELAGISIPLSYSPVKRQNFTQIFRNPLGMSRTAMKTRLRTGDQVRESKRETLELHSIEMERAFFFGAPSETFGVAHPRRSTDGLINIIKTLAPADNYQGQAGVPGTVYDSGAAGAMDMATLEELMELWFRFGSIEKVAFCGNQFALAIQQIIRRNSNTPYTIATGQKEFGMNVTRIFSPFGTLVLKTHPLFNLMTRPATAAPTTAHQGMIAGAVIVDMDMLTYRPLTDGDTKFLPDRQANDIDGMQSEYLTEAGLQVDHPQVHHLVENVISGAVDT